MRRARTVAVAAAVLVVFVGCTRDYDDLFRGSASGANGGGATDASNNVDAAAGVDGQAADVACVTPTCPADGRCEIECAAGCAACNPLACPSRGAGCEIECPAGSTCNITCPEGAGGCNVECKTGATCKVTCQRGPCNLECERGAPCSMTCGSGSCDVDCADGANKVSCGGDSEGCTSCPN